MRSDSAPLPERLFSKQRFYDMLKLPRLKLSDRITWAVLTWIFFNLLWLKFVQDFISQWVGAVIATIAAAALVSFWPRPEEELEAPEDAPEEEEGM
jgi:hypothetical protein